ncbi:MAG TPA: ATP-binding protein [Chloroflexi bacterium]|nr:ATP-binding protein [Chloroflexota bacterium]
MTPEELRALIAGGESLTVEFKSDQGPLSDADLIETVACLANGQGGILLVGVEDDGRLTTPHA